MTIHGGCSHCSSPHALIEPSKNLSLTDKDLEALIKLAGAVRSTTHAALRIAALAPNTELADRVAKKAAFHEILWVKLLNYRRIMRTVSPPEVKIPSANENPDE